MSDVEKIAEAVAGAGEIAKVTGHVYDDLLSPTIKQVGLTAGSAATVVLKTVRGALWAVERIEDYLGDAVQERFRRRRIPDARMRSPDPQVFTNIVIGMVGAGEQSDLREMFANLLTTAMDVSTATGAHPAYGEILRQLSASEARILKQLPPLDPDVEDRGGIVTALVGIPGTTMLEFCSFPSNGDGEQAVFMREPSGRLENLQRLGLVVLKRSWASSTAGPGMAEVQKRIAAMVSLTPFGVGFWEACVSDPVPSP